MSSATFSMPLGPSGTLHVVGGPAAGATLFQAFDLNNEAYQLHSAGDFAAAAPLFQRALDIKLQVGVVDCGPFSRSGDYKW